ncbi:MAG: thermonuclease family protein [Candidatus Aminicenantes bacterium]|nr:thermonuclease family protein [Candidatus Aminicenantes bacterium]
MPKILNTFTCILLILCFLCLFFGFISDKRIQISKNLSGLERDTGVIYVVYDGDTVGIEFPDRRRTKIRLIGIDSPETNHSKEQVRLLAQLSKRFAFYYLYRKQVTVTYDWEREDKYGRLLAYIWTGENGLFNEFILKEGFASAYLQFPFKEEYRKMFIQAEESAKSSNKGLWREEPYPTIPLDHLSSFIGQTAAVQYTCQDVESKGNFNFLHSASQVFSTLIPNNSKKLFEDVEDFKGRVIRVQGFIEEYDGKPQILAFFPRQIKVIGVDKKIFINREKPK